MKTCTIKILTPTCDPYFKRVSVSYSVNPVGGDRLYRLEKVVVEQTGEELDLEWVDRNNPSGGIDHEIAKATQSTFALVELGVDLHNQKKPAKKKPKPQTYEDEEGLPL